MQVVFYFPYPDHDVVIIDATAMITIFCTVVLSVIQGIALNTGVLPFSKGKALTKWYQSIVLPVGSRP